MNSVESMLWGVVLGCLLGGFLGCYITRRLIDSRWRRLTAKISSRHQLDINSLLARESECSRACRGMKHPVETVKGLKATALVVHKLYGVGAEEIQDMEVRV